MEFDPENAIVKLCAAGMALEGAGNPQGALKHFEQAWTEAANDFEKFIVAHYLARHQHNVADKLQWDQEALAFALKVPEPSMKSHYPSLYLNIAKCYEDLGKSESAKKYYDLAFSFANWLPADGYGQMIKSGILSGIKRSSA